MKKRDMKKLISIVFFLFVIQAFSQQMMTVHIVDRPSSMGIKPAFEIVIPKADLNKAENKFNEFIAQKKFFGLINKKTVNQKKGQEWVTQKFTLKAVSDKPMIVLFQISKFTTSTYVRFFFQTDHGFLGADDVGSKQEIAKAKKFVHSYAAGLYRQTVNDEIQAENKELAKLKKKYGRWEQQNNRVRKNADASRSSQDTKPSKSGFVDVDKATERANSFLKNEKKGQKKIRRNQRKQAKLKAEMKNHQIQIEKLKDELNAIE